MGALWLMRLCFPPGLSLPSPSLSELCFPGPDGGEHRLPPALLQSYPAERFSTALLKT